MLDTVVTAFYPTNRGTIANYIEYAKGFTLALPCRIIVFTPSEYTDTIMEIRNNLGYVDRTIIVPMEFEELPMYKYKTKLHHTFCEMQDNMNVAPYSPDYVMVVNSKFWFLEYTIANFPFEYIVWLDFGLAKRGYDTSQMYDFINLRLSDKPRYAIISPEAQITDKNGFLYLAAGGLISVHKSNTKFLQECQDYTGSLIENGKYPLEELALYYMYKNVVDVDVDVYFGEYTTLIYKYNGNHPKSESKKGITHYMYNTPT